MNEKEKSEHYQRNVLVMAYLGDAVFTLMVREFLVERYNYKSNGLNKMANAIVCAKSQAEILIKIKETLTDDEMDIIMRARNSHTNNKAKNSTLEEYSLATQFEAIIGFWHLNGEKNKINDVFNKYVKSSFGIFALYLGRAFCVVVCLCGA